MISLHELYILQVARREGGLDPSRWLSHLKQANQNHQFLVQVLIQRGVVTSDQWSRWTAVASKKATWPDLPQRLEGENQYLYQQILASGRVPADVLQHHLGHCRQQIRQGRPIRLFQALVRQQVLTAAELSQILKILPQTILECTSCGTNWEVAPYYPWHQYPCARCDRVLSLCREDRSAPHTLSPAGHQTTMPSPEGESSGLGRVFGKYQIEVKLGEGGMGAVYRALDSNTNRKVALKVISGGQPSEEVIKRFRREAETASQLNHQHIVPLYEFGKIGQVYYFTMGYIEGQSLRDMVEEKKKLSPQKSLEIGVKVTEAVVYAHESGVMHRDIKPDNIMIDSDGNPHLMDFGLAKKAGGESTRLTKTGAIVGSPEFMAPEQVLGEREVSFPADIYAIGGVLYFMLAGRPCLRADDAMKLMFKVTEEDPRPLSLLNRAVSRDLEVVVHKCLAKSERHRYESAHHLLDDLQALRDGNPISARPPSVAQKLVRWMDKHRGVVAGAVLGILVAVVAMVVIQWKGGTASVVKKGDQPGLEKKDKERGAKGTGVERGEGSPPNSFVQVFVQHEREPVPVGSKFWNRRRNVLVRMKHRRLVPLLLEKVPSTNRSVSRLALEALFYHRNDLTDRQIETAQKGIWNLLKEPVKWREIPREAFFVQYLEIWPVGAGRSWAQSRRELWDRAFLKGWEKEVAREDGEVLARLLHLTRRWGGEKMKTELSRRYVKYVGRLRQEAEKALTKDDLSTLNKVLVLLAKINIKEGWHYYYQGRYYIAKKRYAKAVKSLGSFIYCQPRNYHGCLYMGMALVKIGKYREALRFLTFAGGYNPKDGNMYYWWAQVYINTNRHFLAYRNLERIGEVDPQFANMKTVRRLMRKWKSEYEVKIRRQKKALDREIGKLERIIKLWDRVPLGRKQEFARYLGQIQQPDWMIVYLNQVTKALARQPLLVVREALQSYVKLGWVGLPFIVQLVDFGNEEQKLLALATLRKLAPKGRSYAFHALSPLTNYYHSKAVITKPPGISKRVEKVLFHTVMDMEFKGNALWKQRIIKLGLATQRLSVLLEVLHRWKNDLDMPNKLQWVIKLNRSASPRGHAAIMELLGRWGAKKPWLVLPIIARWERSNSPVSRKAARREALVLLDQLRNP